MSTTSAQCSIETMEWRSFYSTSSFNAKLQSTQTLHCTIFYDQFAFPRRFQTSDECLKHFQTVSKTCQPEFYD